MYRGEIKMTTLDRYTDSRGYLMADSLLIQSASDWYIDSTTQLGRGTYRWPTLDNARSELLASGFAVSSEPCNYAGNYLVTHLATAQAITEQQQRANDEFAHAERGYIRFGACPKNGRSVNNRDNCLEAGVSVFEAEFVGDKYRILLDSTLQATWALVKDRPAYRIYGKVVGTGADGEPVVNVSKAIRL